MAAAVVVLVAVGLRVTGLLPGGTDDPAGLDAPTRSIEPEGLSPTDLPAAPVLQDAEGATSDVTMARCPTRSGTATVRGKVVNPTRTKQDYVISISWVTPRGDVVERAVATVEDLAARGSRSWKATGTVPRGATYACTTQVLRGRL